jgi:hypothetical protein
MVRKTHPIDAALPPFLQGIMTLMFVCAPSSRTAMKKAAALDR